MKRTYLLFWTCLFLLTNGFTLKSQSNTDAKLSTYELMQKFNYDWVSKFYEDLALASKKNKMFVINSSGKKQFDFPYDYSKLIFHEGHACIIKNNKVRLINKKGEIVIDSLFENISVPHNGICIVSKNGENGLYRLKDHKFVSLGAVKITPTLNFNYIIGADKKYGLVDSSGTVLIPMEYQLLRPNNNHFLVKKNNKFGLIDIKNKVIIPIDHEFASILSLEDKTYLKVKKGDLFGLIDTKNELVFPIAYKKIIADKMGYLFLKKDDSYSIYDSDLQKTTSETFSNIRYLTNRKYMLESDSKQILLNTYDKSEKECKFEFSSSFKEGKIVVKNGNKFGIVDTNLVQVIPFIYDKIQFLGKDNFVVKTEKGFNIISQKNELLLKQHYEELGTSFNNGILEAKKNEKWGLINIAGKELSPFKYDRISKLRSSCLYHTTINKQVGLIDLYGQEILPCNNLRIKESHDYMTIIKGSQFGLMQKNGLFNLPLEYQQISPLGLQYGGNYPHLFRVKQNDQVGIYNALEKSKIDYRYSAIDDVRKGVMVARKEGIYGLIDPFGKIIIPFQYAYMQDNGRSNYVLARNKDHKMALFDRSGNLLVPFKYHQIKYLESDMIAVRNSSLWGFINKEHKLVISHQFEEVRGFKDDLCIVINNGLQGMIDKEGDLIIPIDFEKIHPLGEGFFSTEKDSRFGVYNKDGKLLKENIYDCVLPFNHGTSIVGQNDKYGLINADGKLILPIVFDKLKRQSEKKVTRDFNVTSYQSGPSKFCVVTYKEYEFKIDTKGKCVENCPPEEVLNDIFKK